MFDCENCTTWHAPCSTNCPNYVPQVVGKCTACHEDLCEGEDFVEIDGKQYHLDCVESMTTTELLELCGLTVQRAEVE